MPQDSGPTPSTHNAFVHDGAGIDADSDRAAPQLTPPTSTPDAMDAALDDEVASFEIAVASVSVVCAIVGCGISLVVTVGVDREMGIPLMAASLALTVWFLVAHRMLRRGAMPASMRTLGFAFDSGIPALGIVLLVAIRGPEYTLGSWVPPTLFLLSVAFATRRLQPNAPIVAAVVAATTYFALYWFLLRGPLLPDTPLYSPSMQGVRSMSIVLSGLFARYAVVQLRHTLTRAAGRVRAKELFGKYRISDEIASGGMGTVFRATYCLDGGFERPVAIKRIHSHLIRDRRIVDSFRAEAELGAKLQHENIVNTLDFGRVSGAYFLVMEFIDGTDLSVVIKRARAANRELPEPIVLRIAIDIAAALDYAHTRVRGVNGEALRVIHRDLSPANVLVSRRGEVKLTDFGVARTLREGERHETGHLAGKLSYMAPEQVRGVGIDERTDLYSFGLVLYELLTLERAQGRDSDAETLTAMLEGDVPVPTLARADLDSDWDHVLSKLLCQDPADRYSGARTLTTALQVIGARTTVATVEDLASFLNALPNVERSEVEASLTRPLRPRSRPSSPSS